MLQTKPKLSALVILYYELRASPWAKLISWKWLQWVSGHYFAWKVRSKHTRYIASFIHNEIADTLGVWRRCNRSRFHTKQRGAKERKSET